jgi:hypothetical protein
VRQETVRANKDANAMLTPQFTAEASLYGSVHSYQTAGYQGQAGDLVLPTQLHGGIELFPFNCGGTSDRCIETLCAGLEGQERAKCVTLCQQPSICGGCDCRCSPNCTRTCTRRCCRTIIGPPFRQSCCVGDCFRPPLGDDGVLTQD